MATSNIFRSIVMSDRHSILRKSVKHITENKDVDESEATKAVQSALQGATGSRILFAPGQEGMTPANLIVDLCAGEIPQCSDYDAHSPYAPINGRCNNLKHPLWGSVDIPFWREGGPCYLEGTDTYIRLEPKRPKTYYPKKDYEEINKYNHE